MFDISAIELGQEKWPHEVVKYIFNSSKDSPTIMGASNIVDHSISLFISNDQGQQHIFVALEHTIFELPWYTHKFKLTTTV